MPSSEFSLPEAVSRGSNQYNEIFKKNILVIRIVPIYFIEMAIFRPWTCLHKDLVIPDESYC